MSTNLFAEEFKRLLSEEMVTGTVFGIGAATNKGGSVGNSDWYATGDARIPTTLGSKRKKRSKVQRRRLPKEL